ncbi:hypothetical protein AHA02nite_25080 [Alkalibacillus haloalkaliphilus]|uniref:Uncharacterized protein n=1 Tax=Alkalibacillus haloalkaliphilus TaxID=94136 RepID=A0A511WBT6_9BACI|nr:hypothetical protein AHA02nite_25080 [Alkalibacillus haloalkaliphilus]
MIFDAITEFAEDLGKWLAILILGIFLAFFIHNIYSETVLKGSMMK